MAALRSSTPRNTWRVAVETDKSGNCKIPAGSDHTRCNVSVLRRTGNIRHDIPSNSWARAENPSNLRRTNTPVSVDNYTTPLVRNRNKSSVALSVDAVRAYLISAEPAPRSSPATHTVAGSPAWIPDDDPLSRPATVGDRATGSRPLAATNTHKLHSTTRVRLVR